jgi:hypothetical protein
VCAWLRLRIFIYLHATPTMAFKVFANHFSSWPLPIFEVNCGHVYSLLQSN